MNSTPVVTTVKAPNNTDDTSSPDGWAIEPCIILGASIIVLLLATMAICCYYLVTKWNEFTTKPTGTPHKIPQGPDIVLTGTGPRPSEDAHGDSVEYADIAPQSLVRISDAQRQTQAALEEESKGLVYAELAFPNTGTGASIGRSVTY